MADIRLNLDEWQQEALSDLARSRGMAMEAMAKTILNEQLVERIHCAFDDLLPSEALLAADAYNDAPRDDAPRDDGTRDGAPSRDTIEDRLKKLFAD